MENLHPSTPSGSRPEWLVRHLERVGREDTDRVRRSVRLRSCPVCAEAVLVGLDAEVAALAVTLDVRALDRRDELVALLTQRATFELIPARGRFVLEHRHADLIRGRPADPQSRYPVLVEHRCYVPLGRPRPERAPDETSGDPPY